MANEEREIVEALSIIPLGVLVGGFVVGFGGVAIYIPRGEHKPTAIALEPVNRETRRGVVFPYDETARVFIDEEQRWVNRNIKGAPQTRQDIWNETGIVRVQLYKSNDLIDLINKKREAFFNLGLEFDLK